MGDRGVRGDQGAAATSGSLAEATCPRQRDTQRNSILGALPARKSLSDHTQLDFPGDVSERGSYEQEDLERVVTCPQMGGG